MGFDEDSGGGGRSIVDFKQKILFFLYWIN